MAVDLPHPTLPHRRRDLQVARVGRSAGPERPMSPDEFNAAVTAVTNAFGDPTRREIYLFVRDASPATGVTAAEVAEHFELHPNVARHHLEKLTGGGYLTVADRHGRRHRSRPPGARRSATAPPSSTTRSRSPSATTTCSRACSRARSTRSARSRPRCSPTTSGYQYGRVARRHAWNPGAGHRSVADRDRRRRRRAHGARLRGARRDRTAMSSRSSPSAARSARPHSGTRTSCARSTAG